METSSTTQGLEAVRVFREFRDRLDGQIEDARQRYADRMQCRAGCFSCCRNDFRISLIEGFEIREALMALPLEIRRKVHDNLKDTDSPYCPLLVDGQCSVYHRRPLLCRVFGFPVTDGDSVATCELNFIEEREETFRASAFNLNALAETTRTVSKLYLAETGFPLTEGGETPMFRVAEIVASDRL